MSIYNCICGDYEFFGVYHTANQQLYPLNFLETAIVSEKEKDQIFHRRKFDGALVFGGRDRLSDFEFFWDIEQASPCDTIFLAIYKDSVLYWEGYFSTNEGKFDLDECTFTITPYTNDKYAPWEEDGDTQRNIITGVAVITDHVICNGWDYHTSSTNEIWRLLWDVIEYLATQIYTTATVESHLFNDSTDYVTLLPSKLRYLTIAVKSDVKKPLSTNPCGVAYMTFNEMMHILKMFNVYWKYDDILDEVRIEHYSYWTSIAGLDLRNQKIARGSNKYYYDKFDMPKYEYWYPMEGMSPDFKIGIISYDSPCVNQKDTINIWEYSNNVTTEIEIIQDLDYVDGISNEGWVILCNYKIGADYYTYQGPGFVDTTVRYNIYMGWAYLLYAYHRHGRVLFDGYLNVTPFTFNSIRPNKIQTINAVACDEFDEEDFIITELGYDYFNDLPAYVRKATIKPSREVAFVLAYGEPDRANEGISIDKSFNITYYPDTFELTVELSQEAIVDMYFSVLTNEGDVTEVCEQFIITAGTLYQEFLMTQFNPIVSTEWNIFHSSFTGWTVTVNGSTGFDTCSDAECDSGAPAPPAIPPVPTILGIVQSSTCGPLTVSWTAEAGATYYVLQRKPDYGGNDSYITVYSGTNTSYDDPNAGTQDGVTFTYKVAAGNDGGLSAFSTEEDFTAMC